jgi:ABC-type multidrug transport system fused ATPase/permease subunit
MLALATLGFLLGGVHRTVYVRASGRSLFSLRSAIYEHLLRVSPRRLARVTVGDLVSRLDGDIAEIQRFGTDAALSLVSSVLSLIAIGAVMLLLSWRLTLLAAALLPLQLLVRSFCAAQNRIDHPQLRAIRRAIERIFHRDSVGRPPNSGVGGRVASKTQRLGRLGEPLSRAGIAPAMGHLCHRLAPLRSPATP